MHASPANGIWPLEDSIEFTSAALKLLNSIRSVESVSLPDLPEDVRADIRHVRTCLRQLKFTTSELERSESLELEKEQKKNKIEKEEKAEEEEKDFKEEFEKGSTAGGGILGVRYNGNTNTNANAEDEWWDGGERDGNEDAAKEREEQQLLEKKDREEDAIAILDALPVPSPSRSDPTLPTTLYDDDIE